MTNIQRSYKDVKNLLFGKNNTDEKELYRHDMEDATAMNRFF